MSLEEQAPWHPEWVRDAMARVLIAEARVKKAQEELAQAKDWLERLDGVCGCSKQAALGKDT